MAAQGSESHSTSMGPSDGSSGAKKAPTQVTKSRKGHPPVNPHVSKRGRAGASAAPDQLASLGVKELKTRLKGLGAVPKGLKADLIDQLRHELRLADSEDELAGEPKRSRYSGEMHACHRAPR